MLVFVNFTSGRGIDVSDDRLRQHSPSRRALGRAAAWGTPTLVLVTAAPVTAGSAPKVGTVTATKKVVKGVQQVTLTIPVTGAPTSSTITITAISGGNGPNTWQLPVTASITGGSASALVIRNNNASGTYTATYVINPGGYTGTFVFTV